MLDTRLRDNTIKLQSPLSCTDSNPDIGQILLLQR
jgi:hypothetical protein